MSPVAEDVRQELKQRPPDPMLASQELTVAEQVAARGRPLFGQPVPQLEYPIRDGYVGRWFNDHPGRIKRALECGYQHVKDDEGRPVTRPVGKTIPLQAFLMEIPKDFYDEDFALKQMRDDETAEALMARPIDDAGYRFAPGESNLPRSRQTVRRSQPAVG